jgi:DNA replication initiation complex subunit (GINS family)
VIGGMAENINITYDLLFDILRYEKSRDELQALDKEFFTNIVEYLHTKDSTLLAVHTSPSERELTRIQLNNVKKILTELYDRREKKIINLALYKIKTGQDTINTSALLDDEKILFDSIFLVLSKYRSTILDNILNSKPPFAKPIEQQAITQLIQAKPELIDDDAIKSIRFIKPVPKFLGPELETYGPFEEQDIASLPSVIANILIRKERAEEMHIKH